MMLSRQRNDNTNCLTRIMRIGGIRPRMMRVANRHTALETAETYGGSTAEVAEMRRSAEESDT